MIDLKKLLVADGRPSKEMIDHIVDSNIKKMIEEFTDHISQNSHSGSTIIEGYLNIEKKHQLYAHFSVPSYPQYLTEIINDVRKSVERYESFLNVKERPQDLFEKARMSPERPTLTEFTLILEITPEMKKMLLLDNELEQKDSESNRRPKI